ncbi:hypothetical protein TNCV_3110341 [Trichonephila clavipes]|nr:hypothetical protein TNCV_3110341 [Trichonephila clavipes]
MTGLRTYSESQVMLGTPAMREPTKKPSREPSQIKRKSISPLLLDLAYDKAFPLYGHSRVDGDHLLQCTGLDEYPADDIVIRYCDSRHQMD